MSIAGQAGHGVPEAAGLADRDERAHGPGVLSICEYIYIYVYIHTHIYLYIYIYVYV